MKITQKTRQLIELCSYMNACNDALEWLFKHCYTDIYELYYMCDRGDWIMWVLNKIEVDKMLLIPAACDCVETVIKYVPREYVQILGVVNGTIQSARKFASGETHESVRQPLHICIDSCTNSVIGASECISRCTRSRIYDISNSVCSVRGAAKCVGKEVEIMRQCADIVRQHVLFPVFKEYFDAAYDRHSRGKCFDEP